MALRDRLRGCSHVYVWEISNDERMPFHVWTGGASVRRPTLTRACSVRVRSLYWCRGVPQPRVVGSVRNPAALTSVQSSYCKWKRR